MIKKGIMTVAVLGLLAGCAAPARMHTPHQWQENTSRRFPGKSPQEVLLACKEVLRLADEKDVRFAQEANRVLASRRWGKNLVVVAGFGVWNFDLTTVPTDGGTVATLKIVGTSHSVAEMTAESPSGTTAGKPGGDVAAPAAPSAGGYGWPFAPAYDLFWRRMEAVLYGSEWYSCRWYIADPSVANSYSFTLDPLCFNASDNRPLGAVVSQTERKYWKSKKEGEEVAVTGGGPE